MNAHAFNSFVPSEPSWTMERTPQQVAHDEEDNSSCGSVETNCSLAMSFPDPDNSLAKTQDSLSTQPDWKTTRLSNFRYSDQPSWNLQSLDAVGGPRLSNADIISTVNGTKNDSHSQTEPIEGKWTRWTRIASSSIQTAWHHQSRNRKFLFIAAPILILLLTLTILPSTKGHSAHDLTCQLTGHSSFIGCAVEQSQAPESKSKGPENGKVNTPILVQLQIQTLSNVVENSQGIGKTAVEIRRTGIVMSELQSLLEASDLSGKYELSEAISDYRSHSFHVGRGLEQFRSNLLATLGSLAILSNNLVNEVEAGGHASSTAARWLMKIVPGSSRGELTERLYSELAEYNRGELHDLHAQAVGQLHALDGVNRDLHSIHSLAAHGKRRKEVQLEDLLGELFTRLGGNRGKVTKHQEDLELLGVVGKGYREARAQVEGIVQQLEMMTLDLQSASGKAGAASKLGLSGGPGSVRTLKGMTEQLLERAHDRLQIGTPSQVVQRYLDRE